MQADCNVNLRGGRLGNPRTLPGEIRNHHVGSGIRGREVIGLSRNVLAVRDQIRRPARSCRRRLGDAVLLADPSLTLLGGRASGLDRRPYNSIQRRVDAFVGWGLGLSLGLLMTLWHRRPSSAGQPWSHADRRGRPARRRLRHGRWVIIAIVARLSLADQGCQGGYLAGMLGGDRHSGVCGPP